MRVRSVLDALQAVAARLGWRYGDFTVTLADSQVTLVRRGEVYKPEDLAEMELPDVDSES